MVLSSGAWEHSNNHFDHLPIYSPLLEADSGWKRKAREVWEGDERQLLCDLSDTLQTQSGSSDAVPNGLSQQGGGAHPPCLESALLSGPQRLLMRVAHTGSPVLIFDNIYWHVQLGIMFGRALDFRCRGTPDTVYFNVFKLFQFYSLIGKNGNHICTELCKNIFNWNECVRNNIKSSDMECALSFYAIFYYL